MSKLTPYIALSLIIIGLTLILVGTNGCGRKLETAVVQGDKCTIAPYPGGSEITCGDSTAVILNGADGTNAAATLANGIAPGCAAGGSTLFTSLDTNRNGIADAGDENLQSAEICNGTAGADGEDGATVVTTSAFTPVALLDPCGDAPGVFDEIFLKLANGTIISSFSDNENGKNTRFSVIAAGTNYVTTDGDGCHFSIDADGNLINEHR